ISDPIDKCANHHLGSSSDHTDARPVLDGAKSTTRSDRGDTFGRQRRLHSRNTCMSAPVFRISATRSFSSDATNDLLRPRREAPSKEHLMYPLSSPIRRFAAAAVLFSMLTGLFAGIQGASANSAPVAANDAFTMGSNGTLNVAAPGVLKNDTDAHGNKLLVTELGAVSPGAALSLSGNGSFAFTPPAGFVGNAFFQYKVTDGVAVSNFATVNITVTAGGAVNVAPIAQPDSFNGIKGRRLRIDAKGVLQNDTDANNDQLKASLVTKPALGTLVLKQDGGFVFTPPSMSF